MTAFFYAAWLAREKYRRFLVNEHDMNRLYFLLHNFRVQIIVFERENLKQLIGGKKDKAECEHKPLLEDANYYLEMNDSRHFLK